jgi:NAD(P)-dependent dehydrogenase (short-subunit alcohol dehydrogenase family)
MFTANDVPDLKGKTVVVTGANSGLGLETTRVLAAKGALVVMGCRDAGRAAVAADEVKRTAPHARLDVRALDLSSLSSIANFATQVRASHPAIDVLVNNAGVMALPKRHTTADGFELQFGTNHLGHFALTAQLFDALEAAPAARVVSVASMAHLFGQMSFDDLMGERRYSSWGAYGQSKLSNLLFVFELERRLRAAGKKTQALNAHPGYSATNLQSTSARFMSKGLDSLFMDLGAMTIAQSAAMGALPSLYAATMPDAKGGEYFGPAYLEMRGPPKRVQARPKARNADDAQRLWNVSLELTRVRWSLE